MDGESIIHINPEGGATLNCAVCCAVKLVLTFESLDECGHLNDIVSQYMYFAKRGH